MRLAIALAALAMLLAGCDTSHVCTLMAPYCALTMKLEHQWQPGTYEFQLALPEGTESCTGTLPQQSPAEFECTADDLTLHPVFTPPQEGEWPTAISFYGSPSSAELIILRDGVELARRTLTPKYEVTEPNGEGCGLCENATETIAF